MINKNIRKNDNLNWWRGSVIYQIYIRSFKDSNDDGVGDLGGIIQKLDYISSLGVDAIWITPFYPSPMKDFGYDVSDYQGIEPMFGAFDQFEELLDRAHRLGLKVIIDQVLSHCSDEHPWFQESKKSKNNPKADWFVWSDSKDDGTPPNNWQSVFGGPAWSWSPEREQYYFHNFLAQQPDLNFHNPEVQEALLSNLEFWLKKGVDGFRLDAANFYFHDKLLRSNPKAQGKSKRNDLIDRKNPYAYQIHLYDKSRPENITFYKKIRSLTDRYCRTVTMAEIGDQNSLDLIRQYTEGNDKLHMGYFFNLSTDEFSANHIKEVVQKVENTIGDGYCCWALNSHDVKRVVTRWGKNEEVDSFAKVIMALLLSMNGSVCLYQGEELGLNEAEVPYSKLKDPYGLKFWPKIKGRDGQRTPMPWEKEAPYGGFSKSEPWLPVYHHHLKMAVDVQESNQESVLNFYRRFLKWRKKFQALIRGKLKFYDGRIENCLLFERFCEAQRVLVVINLSKDEMKIEVPMAQSLTTIYGHGFSGKLTDKMAILGPYDAYYALINNN